MVERGFKRRIEDVPNLGGSIEVIIGGMFSGKSDELIRRVRRAPYAKETAQIFKPIVDNRREPDTINTYDGLKEPAISVSNSSEILERLDGDTTWVAVDEAQFFDRGLSEVCNKLALQGKRVIVAGLDADYRGERFGPMDDLVRDAERVTKLNASCNVCGETASRTQRLLGGEPASYDGEQVVVGEEEYEARCRFHHQVPKE